MLGIGFGYEWGGNLETPSRRILVVEDSTPFRKFVCSALEKRQEFQIIAEVSDGLEAVQKAEELRPDLILLDVGLPSLNGIEVARRIRKLSPESKILFLSQECSVDLVQEALDAGALGYVVKIDAGTELLDATSAVLRGERFVGRRLSGHDFLRASNTGTAQEFRSETVCAPVRQNTEIHHRHEVRFYPEDDSFLQSFAGFISAAIRAGNAVIVVATESHRNSVLLRLQAAGLDIRSAVDEGRYISLDAAETVATFMVNDLPDPCRFRKITGNLIEDTAKAVKVEHGRVVACGECAPLLWSQGKAEAAIRLEHLWDEIAKSYGIDVLCGYPASSFQNERHTFEKICAEHSAAYFQ